MAREGIEHEWHVEPLYDEIGQTFRIDETLYVGEGGLQAIRVVRNARLGKVLLLDGVVQTTEADEFVYHEMLTHTPILAHGSVKNVLIIGGGDGGMLREVLKHESVEEVVMVEIDRGVVEFSKEHLPALSDGAFDSERLDLKIMDGAKYMARGRKKFDVIILDRTDPIGPGLALYTDTFYADCAKRLRKGGILVTQNGVPFFQADELRETIVSLRKVFDNPTAYLGVVPTYYGGFMAFGWASDAPTRLTVSEKTLRERYEAAGLNTRYYSPEVHKAAFALPPFIKELVT